MSAGVRVKGFDQIPESAIADLRQRQQISTIVHHVTEGVLHGKIIHVDFAVFQMCKGRQNAEQLASLAKVEIEEAVYLFASMDRRSFPLS